MMSCLSGTDLSVSCGGCGDFGLLIGTAGSGSGSSSPAALELTLGGKKQINMGPHGRPKR